MASTSNRIWLSLFVPSQVNPMRTPWAGGAGSCAVVTLTDAWCESSTKDWLSCGSRDPEAEE
jgi:hypothetical protein